MKEDNDGDYDDGEGFVALNHTQWQTHTHTLGRTPLDECSAPRRPPPDNSQHSQHTDIHASGGISKPQSEQASVVADPRL